MLCLAAAKAACELLAQRAAAAKQQCLDGRHRDLELGSDLLQRTPLELTHDQRRALVVGQKLERAHQILDCGGLLVGDQLADVLLPRDRPRPASRLADMLAAGVVRDRPQPVAGLPGTLTALDRAIRVDERRLGHILGIRRAA